MISISIITFSTADTHQIHVYNCCCCGCSCGDGGGAGGLLLLLLLLRFLLLYSSLKKYFWESGH
jgi:hypothetical protein